jgi:hypothetical protein
LELLKQLGVVLEHSRYDALERLIEDDEAAWAVTFGRCDESAFRRGNRP